jgi:HAD superfamily hydrolase (TIGR01450 family)
VLRGVSDTRPPLRTLEPYRAVLFDLDGTLYRGDAPLPGAGDFVAACRTRGLGVLFGTNNALLTRETIAARLRRMGIEASEEELVTAPDALVGRLRHDDRSDVVRLGGAGMRATLDAAGLPGPEVADADPGAVQAGVTVLAVGLDPTRSLSDVARGAALVEAGAVVYATAAEPHYPTDHGVEAGTGVLLAALRSMVAFEATLCGKPSRIFGQAVADAVGGGEAGSVLVVGDSLPADVGVATEMGWDALLVLTGSARAADVPASGGPDFVAVDLAEATRELAPRST